MTVLISGVAFPIDKLNANGEGIPFAETENAIESLKNAVVRICSRNDPHGCDFAGDPRAEIGRVVEAWLENGNVYATAEISDSDAARKIEDGVWNPGWSIYGWFDDIDPNGWVRGIDIKSITIVNDPAWETANWNVISASVDRKGFRSNSSFRIVSASKKTGSGNITEEYENRIKELEKQLEDSKVEIAELKQKAEAEAGENVAELTQQVAELSASNKTLTDTISAKDKIIASFEKEKAGAVPMEKLQEIIASAIAEHDKEVLAINERNTAMSAFSAARSRLGIETKPEDFKTLSASDLEKLTNDLNGLKIGASGSGIRYPSSSGGQKNGATVGRYDTTKREWVV